MSLQICVIRFNDPFLTTNFIPLSPYSVSSQALGKIYLHRYGRHLDIARGQSVHYAGEVQFSGRTNRGELRWWNNQSGHYRPDNSSAIQAGLPIDKFMAFY